MVVRKAKGVGSKRQQQGESGEAGRCGAVRREAETQRPECGFIRATRPGGCTPECIYLSALSVCHKMYCLWISCRILARMAACKSVSMYSKTK